MASPSPTLPGNGRGTPPGGGARPSLARRIMVAAAAICAAGALTVAAGFWWFVWSVPTEEVRLDRSADGIVALTGGSSRVVDAMELLSAGHGRRLLISGVYRATTGDEIARMAPAYDRLIRCCVDLDHSAVNTVGNAIETKRWAERHGITSLIVVTSNYHMPRAMAELARQLPEVALIPFPVVTNKMRHDPWWNPSTARLLLSEYLKYVVAQVRMRLETTFAARDSDEPRLAKR